MARRAPHLAFTLLVLAALAAQAYTASTILWNLQTILATTNKAIGYPASETPHPPQGVELEPTSNTRGTCILYRVKLDPYKLKTPLQPDLARIAGNPNPCYANKTIQELINDYSTKLQHTLYASATLYLAAGTASLALTLAPSPRNKPRDKPGLPQPLYPTLALVTWLLALLAAKTPLLQPLQCEKATLILHTSLYAALTLYLASLAYTRLKRD